MPPSRTRTYSNLAPVRASIAGIASWLRKALGLPKSNRNCGDVLVKASSRIFYERIVAQGASCVHLFDDDHNILSRGYVRSDQAPYRPLAPHQHVIAHLQNEHGAEGDGVGGPDAVETDGAAEKNGRRDLDGDDGENQKRQWREHRSAGTH